MPRILAAALTVGAVVWVIVLLGAAALGGTGGAAGAVHALASGVCHQRPERSFALNGVPLAVCARCAGLYASGALGAAVAWGGASRRMRHSRELLLLAALPTVVTLPIEWLGLSSLSNGIRAAAALPLGAVAGWTFVHALRSESEPPSRAPQAS